MLHSSPWLNIFHLDVVQISWQFRNLSINPVSIGNEGNWYRFLSSHGHQQGSELPGVGRQISEDCKNCALLRTLASHRGLPACPWSVSSAGLFLETDSSNEWVLGFQSGEPSLHQPDFLERFLPLLKVPGAWRIGSSSLSNGVSKFLRHNIFVATIC